MNKLNNAVDYVSSKAQGLSSQASKETNKQVAKDSHAPLGTRARATKDMMHDKVDEHRHKTNAELNKEAAKH